MAGKQSKFGKWYIIWVSVFEWSIKFRILKHLAVDIKSDTNLYCPYLTLVSSLDFGQTLVAGTWTFYSLRYFKI